MANIKRAPEVHGKTPDEIRIINMEFAADIDKDDTISGVTSTTITPSGELTAGSPTFNGTIVQLTLSNGVKGKSYIVDVIATTTKGETVAGSGKVEVDEA